MMVWWASELWLEGRMLKHWGLDGQRCKGKITVKYEATVIQLSEVFFIERCLNQGNLSRDMQLRMRFCSLKDTHYSLKQIHTQGSSLDLRYVCRFALGAWIDRADSSAAQHFYNNVHFHWLKSQWLYSNLSTSIFQWLLAFSSGKNFG